MTKIALAKSSKRPVVNAALRAGFSRNEVQAGVAQYERKERISHPVGEFDKAGRFHLAERCACCLGLRWPTRAYPFSEMAHGRTIRHVATLYGVDEGSVRCVAGALAAHGVRPDAWVARKLRNGARAAAKRRLASATSAHERLAAEAALAALKGRKVVLAPRPGGKRGAFTPRDGDAPTA
jgi:hypothetical protein